MIVPDEAGMDPSAWKRIERALSDVQLDFRAIPKPNLWARLSLASDHFKQVPYQQLRALMFTTLRAAVKEGAYTNRKRALQRLPGFLYDVKHIATYAPYVGGFIMDQPMAELVSKQTVALEQTYGTKVFSPKNWEELFAWLDSPEAGMSDEHKASLAAAYSYRSIATTGRPIHQKRTVGDP